MAIIIELLKEHGEGIKKIGAGVAGSVAIIGGAITGWNFIPPEHRPATRGYVHTVYDNGEERQRTRVSITNIDKALTRLPSGDARDGMLAERERLVSRWAELGGDPSILPGIPVAAQPSD
jgi:hypothetical protein